MKFEDVLRIDTWVVEVPRARALVKRVHIMPLKTRLRMKKSWGCIVSYMFEEVWLSEFGGEEGR